MSGWSALDPGAESLLLVGPILPSPPDRDALAAAGLADLPQLAVDRGIDFAPAAFLWAGDGDSSRIPQHIPAMIKESQEKTDLRFCLDGIRAWRWRNIHLIGFTGARLDHELANYGEVYGEMKRRPQTRQAVFYDGGLQPVLRFLPAGESGFTRRGRFSVLSFEPAEVSITGACRYPAAGLMLEPLSGQGVSNEADGEVTIRASHPVALMFA